MAAAKKKGNQKKAKNKAKKAKAEGGGEEASAGQAHRNPRAFSFQSANKAKAARARSAEKEQRRLHGGHCYRNPKRAEAVVHGSAAHAPPAPWISMPLMPMFKIYMLLLLPMRAAPLAQALECDLPPPMVVLVQGPPGVSSVCVILV